MQNCTKSPPLKKPELKKYNPGCFASEKVLEQSWPWPRVTRVDKQGLQGQKQLGTRLLNQDPYRQ